MWVVCVFMIDYSGGQNSVHVCVCVYTSTTRLNSVDPS